MTTVLIPGVNQQETTLICVQQLKICILKLPCGQFWTLTLQCTQQWMDKRIVSAAVLREAPASSTLARVRRWQTDWLSTSQGPGGWLGGEPMDEGLRTRDTAGRKSVIFTGQSHLRREAAVLTSWLLEILS